MGERECPQAWQAEAIDDGRLSGADRKLFERHALSCPVCATELAHLAKLRDVMSHLPQADSSPFVRRRLRAQLLERAAKDGWSNRSPLATRPRVALAGALLMVAIALLGRFRWSRGEPLSAHFEVENVQAADWREEQVGETTRLRLRSGSAAFRVQRIAEHQRFLLALPDGEIEVHGTRFRVDIAEEHTASVQVSEGIVALRLLGQPERTLRAGDGWSRSANPSQPALAIAADPVPSAPAPLASVAQDSATGAAPVARDPVVATPAAKESPVVAAPPTSHSAPQPGRGGVDSFAAGVAAFEAGDYRSADSSLSRFLEERPGDPRCEDASFLRALAHSRWGDKHGAAQLAQGYLARFPAGLRRKEAEHLVEVDVKPAAGARATSPSPESASTLGTGTRTPPK